MSLLRYLFLTSMQYNFLIRCKHVPGTSNGIADAISRFQVDRFRKLAPEAR
jgi:hypothetical protein